MQYRITLQAGVEKRQVAPGKNFVLVSTGAATELELKIEIQGYPTEEFRSIKHGFKMRSPGFTSCILKASVDCTIEIVTSDADISINYQDGATVNANIINQPLDVVPDRGAIDKPVYVVGMTYENAPASARIDNAAVTAGPTAVLLLAANQLRKEVRICNLGPDEVVIGSSGITWNKRVIVLAAKDTFFDNMAAALEFYVITNAGKTANITTQEIIA